MFRRSVRRSMQLAATAVANKNINTKVALLRTLEPIITNGDPLAIDKYIKLNPPLDLPDRPIDEKLRSEYRILIKNANTLISVLSMITTDKESTNLLRHLGKQHVSPLINHVHQLVSCRQPKIMHFIDQNKLKSMINTFEHLKEALAWSSDSTAYDKLEYNDNWCGQLLDLLGQDHVMSLIPTGNELAELLSNVPTQYNNGMSAAKIDTTKLISFIKDRLGDFKNRGTSEERMSHSSMIRRHQ